MSLVILISKIEDNLKCFQKIEHKKMSTSVEAAMTPQRSNKKHQEKFAKGNKSPFGKFPFYCVKCQKQIERSRCETCNEKTEEKYCFFCKGPVNSHGFAPHMRQFHANEDFTPFQALYQAIKILIGTDRVQSVNVNAKVCLFSLQH